MSEPVQPPADLHEPPTNLHARIYRAVYLSPAGAAAEAVLAELEPELAALREQLVAAQAEIARLRADLADDLALPEYWARQRVAAHWNGARVRR